MGGGDRFKSVAEDLLVESSLSLSGASAVIPVGNFAARPPPGSFTGDFDVEPAGSKVVGVIVLL